MNIEPNVKQVEQEAAGASANAEAVNEQATEATQDAEEGNTEG
jgi:hypothetical protein